MTPQFQFTPDEFHLWPSMAILTGRCENPNCGEAHGYLVVVAFLWWQLGIPTGGGNTEAKP